MNRKIIFIIFIFNIFVFCAGISKNTSISTRESIKETQKSRARRHTTLTLHEAIEIAYCVKPNIKLYKHAVEESKMVAQQALSGYFPQVTLTSGISKNRGDPTTNYKVNVIAEQLVYSFAGPIEKYKKARKNMQIVSIEGDKEKKELRHELEKVFLECWKLQQQSKVVNALYKAAKSDLQKARHAYKVHLTDKSEWLKSLSAYKDSMRDIDIYYDSITLGQKKLEFFMGQPIKLSVSEAKVKGLFKDNQILEVTLIWDETKDVSLKSLGYYYSLANKTKEDLKIADKKIAIARDDLYIARGSRLPTVGLTAGIDYTAGGAYPSVMSADQPFSVNHHWCTHNFGIGLSWKIFDGALSRFEENAAHAKILKEILTKDDTHQKIQWDIQKAYYQLSQDRIKWVAKNAELTAAHNDLVLNKKKFEIGDISKVEFNVSVSNWERAYFEWLDGKTAMLIDARDLAYQCGYPDELSR
jgi:outer membrane protein TolC